ncbi:MAG: GGDEF domain-containing protein [Sulfuritalea sp.]|jgi:diguanylate cyclase (GGDEF)-like protein|nr:GGDEF domain-containing protein [Sulfuritalea sp.]
MFKLDVRSIILIAGIMSLLMAIALHFMKRNYPSSIKGLAEWAAAPMILFVATLLFAARGAIPNLFSIVLANLLLFGGASLLYFGSQRFFGVGPSIPLWSGLAALVLLPIAWFALIEPHHGIRVALIASFMASLAFAHARLILSSGPHTFSTYFAGAAQLLLAFAQTSRFFVSFDLPAGDAIFDNSSSSQASYVAIYAFAILAGTIGMILMATDRLRGELEHLATHDSLTGALNRRALIDACELELARCRRNHGVMALLMIDLDHFKAINDTHGHPVGDRVLIDFVARVKSLLRQPDRLGRFGGEEFVALLPETPLNEARVVAERLRAMIEAKTEDLPPCTVSIGVTVSRSDDAGLDEIISRADAALYQAKHAGRNRIESVIARPQ